MVKISENEQFTESLTRQLMQFEIGQNDGFYVYPQSVDSNLSLIKECLNKAGGKPQKCPIDEFPNNTKGKGTGRPEFIITLENDPNTIIIVECKKSRKEHISDDLSEPKKYAVDGILYYAKYLKENFNIIAVAISGTKKDDYSANAYYWRKNDETYKEIEKTSGVLLTPLNYVNILTNKQLVKKFSVDDIKLKANLFNELMRDSLNIQPQERILFIASCLLALKDASFQNTYNTISDNKALIDNLISAVSRTLNNSGIPQEKISLILNNSKLIKGYTTLIETKAIEDGSLLYFLKQLDLDILPMMNDFTAHQDILGIFYHEFIKYTAGGVGHELGIVLTPEHLCDFMCEVAGLSTKDTVIDIACGTGSFLVSAMKHMINKAKNSKEIEHIKQKQLFGIEQQASIYTIATTNMIIRGDGQSNIYNGDCFKVDKKLFLKNNDNKEPKFRVGLLNPPYSQKSVTELKFVLQMLDMLEPRGIGVVVVPASCAIGRKFKEERKRLFEKHTLKAVFSMPDDIFYPVGTNVCVMVWEAHREHDKTKPTFFGYYKNDGFIKKKHLGRIDANNKWENIKNEWLKLYNENIIVAGKSASKCVTEKDEWLVEAYMETDYSNLTDSDFERTIRDYLAYQVKYENKN